MIPDDQLKKIDAWYKLGAKINDVFSRRDDFPSNVFDLIAEEMGISRISLFELASLVETFPIELVRTYYTLTVSEWSTLRALKCNDQRDMVECLADRLHKARIRGTSYTSDDLARDAQTVMYAEILKTKAAYLADKKAKKKPKTPTQELSDAAG